MNGLRNLREFQHHMTKLKQLLFQTLSKVLRLQPGHKFCLLGRLSSEVGWHHYDTIKALEERRKYKAKVFYERKKQLIQLQLKAEKLAREQLSDANAILAPLSYKA